MGTDWLDSLESVGGRLVPAARIFVGSEHPPERAAGPEGVRWLAAQLEDFVDRDTDHAEDDRFVEGAGALLGLLLIDHLGGRTRERDGRHRVQLGRFGWFDPFGAIQEALDAEDPRACLAEYLRIAEQEATERGPVSRVIRTFADELRRERPDLEILSHFELTVDLDNGTTVDLGRLERVTNDQDQNAATEAARRIISMLPGAGSAEPMPWIEAAPRLLPRLVSTSFLESLSEGQSLHTDELGLGVHVALQIRFGSRARYVADREVAHWPVDRTAARVRAVENLSEKSRSLRLEPVAEAVFRVCQGDGLDGVRLLLPDLAIRLGRVVDARWLAASPHRDVLLVSHGDGVPELTRLAQDAVRRAPHPVSASLFEITAHGPRPLRW